MLEGTLMKKVRCRIYETRPSVCRNAVKPGNKNCLEIRRILLRAKEST
jgi:Fe-S-cluster containining protein